MPGQVACSNMDVICFLHLRVIYSPALPAGASVANHAGEQIGCRCRVRWRCLASEIRFYLRTNPAQKERGLRYASEWTHAMITPSLWNVPILTFTAEWQPLRDIQIRSKSFRPLRCYAPSKAARDLLVERIVFGHPMQRRLCM